MNDQPAEAEPRGWRRLRRPRLTSGLLVGLGTYALLLLISNLNARLRFIAGWDVGATFALVAMFFGLRNSSAQAMKAIAERQDVGKWAVLILSIFAAGASVVVIATEMPRIKSVAGIHQVAGVLAIAYTIVLSWAFVQTMFALHYAHDYYLDADSPSSERGPASDRLVFPGERSPTYGDFLYFSFTIGMTFQTSDVEIADPAFRHLVLVQGVIAFFNTTVILALAINLVAGLI